MAIRMHNGLTSTPALLQGIETYCRVSVWHLKYCTILLGRKCYKFDIMVKQSVEVFPFFPLDMQVHDLLNDTVYQFSHPISQ